MCEPSPRHMRPAMPHLRFRRRPERHGSSTEVAAFFPRPTGCSEWRPSTGREFLRQIEHSHPMPARFVPSGTSGISRKLASNCTFARGKPESTYVKMQKNLPCRECLVHSKSRLGPNPVMGRAATCSGLRPTNLPRSIINGNYKARAGENQPPHAAKTAISAAEQRPPSLIGVVF